VTDFISGREQGYFDFISVTKAGSRTRRCVLHPRAAGKTGNAQFGTSCRLDPDLAAQLSSLPPASTITIVPVPHSPDVLIARCAADIQTGDR